MAGEGTIMGSVRTLDNKPVANARVVVSSPLERTPMMAEYTSNDGSFVVSGLRSGMYDVRAESGVQEAEQRVQVNGGQAWVTMRMPDASRSAQPGAAGGNSTVSVQQLHVPEKAASFLQKAQEALGSNKLEEAGKYVSKALETYPEYSQALAFRGVLEMHQQQIDKATEDATHAIQADPSDGMGYLVMGAILNAQDKYKDALVPLQRAETLMPGAWQGYFESGKALLQLQKFQDALQQVNKAMALTDLARHPELHLVKGYAYMGLRVYGAALGELEQYVNQVPASPYSASIRSTLEKIRPLAAAAVPVATR
jgi:Flp pilus assembly protein TadD